MAKKIIINKPGSPNDRDVEVEVRGFEVLPSGVLRLDHVNGDTEYLTQRTWLKVFDPATKSALPSIGEPSGDNIMEAGF